MKPAKLGPTRFAVKLVALCWCLVALTAAAPSVNVPIDHWGYRFIERFEARGLLQDLAAGIKPFSRLQMARALHSIAAAATAGQSLSRIERAELARLEAEFRPELAQLRGADKGEPQPQNKGWKAGQPLLHYRRDDGELWGDLLVRQQTDLFTGRGRDQREEVFRNRLGGVLRGHLGGRLGFRIAFEQTREQGTRTYFLRDDVFEPRLEVPQLKGGLVDYHEGRGYLTFDLGGLAVEAGRDEVRWGPAPGDNLGLSNNAPAFDMVRLRTRLGGIELVSIAGSLRPCPARGDSPLCQGTADSLASYISQGNHRVLERDKYLAAHRLEAALTPWLDVGFQEVVVYGDRGLQYTYLNPVMFYWAAQSYLGDKDNLMMGLDFDFHPGGGFKAYLAYVVDDLKKLKIFSDDFANKFSLQSGLLWVDPLGLGNAELRAEYVRIEPWIYTHKFAINTFRHFDGPLGHSLGPNSDRWQIGIQWRPKFGVELHTGVGRSRHGDNIILGYGADGAPIIDNVGGDLHLGRRAGDERSSKDFLAGRVGKRTQVQAGVEWRLQSQLVLKGGYAYEWGDGVPVGPRWEDNIALEKRTGYGDGGQQHISFELRYRRF
ncbi:MAG: hypothetical protein GKR89_24545 [Candidatus Latescibacteria bacterium]|nr:hypothetical protein [Candidatus Latescibacterota bacterium]